MVLWARKRLGIGFLGLVLASSLLTGGCQKAPNRKTCYPVEGRVLVNGKPAVGALVVFFPEDKSDSNSPSASGATDENGNFALSTYDTEDGAPPGPYIVTVTWEQRSLVRQKDPLKRGGPPDKSLDRYKLAKTSPLRATVEAQPNKLKPFELK